MAQKKPTNAELTKRAEDAEALLAHVQRTEAERKARLEERRAVYDDDDERAQIYGDKLLELGEDMGALRALTYATRLRAHYGIDPAKLWSYHKRQTEG